MCMLVCVCVRCVHGYVCVCVCVRRWAIWVPIYERICMLYGMCVCRVCFTYMFGCAAARRAIYAPLLVFAIYIYNI